MSKFRIHDDDEWIDERAQQRERDQARRERVNNKKRNREQLYNLNEGDDYNGKTRDR